MISGFVNEQLLPLLLKGGGRVLDGIPGALVLGAPGVQGAVVLSSPKTNEKGISDERVYIQFIERAICVKQQFRKRKTI